MCFASSSPVLYFNLISLSLHNRLKSDNHIKRFFWRRSIRKWLLEFIVSWGSTEGREPWPQRSILMWTSSIMEKCDNQSLCNYRLLSIKQCNAVSFSPGEVMFPVMCILCWKEQNGWLPAYVVCVLDAGLSIRLLSSQLAGQPLLTFVAVEYDNVAGVMYCFCSFLSSKN